MGVKGFRFDRDLAEDFVDFGYDHYRNDPGWVPPMRAQMDAQMQPKFAFYKRAGNRHVHFLVRAAGRVVARASATINTQLQHPDGGAVGAIGFFESIDDDNVATDLLDSAVGWLRDEGVAHVWGPLNFDIWHGYRFMAVGFERERFFGEPYNRSYYPELFTRYGFVPLQTWTSVEYEGRAAFAGLTQGLETHYQRFLDRGFRFEPANMSRLPIELGHLYRLVCDAFGDFPGFTPITQDEFHALFATSRYAMRDELLNFVFDPDDRRVAFGTAFLDIADAARAMNGRRDALAHLRFMWRRRGVDRVIVHMGGKTKQAGASTKGIGLAGLVHLVRQIEGLGYGRIVVALMAIGSPFEKLMRRNKAGARREYILYELSR